MLSFSSKYQTKIFTCAEYVLQIEYFFSLRHKTNPRDKVRVYGLCDSAMFAVPYDLAKLLYEQKKSAHCQRPNILFAPHNIFISKRVFFLMYVLIFSCFFSSFVAEIICNTVLTELCVFAASEIYP